MSKRAERVRVCGWGTLVIVVLLGLLAGCGGGGGATVTTVTSDSGAVAATTPQGTPTPTPTPARMDVTPVAVAVPLGATQAFKATATWGDGSTTDVTNLAAWTSSDPKVATVDAGGAARAVSPGAVTIAAALGGVTGKAALTVNTPGETVTNVTVTPAQATVPVGGHQQLTATATFGDGHQQDVTASAGWATADPTIATVAQGGSVTAVATGSTTVTAHYGQTGQATIDVVP